MGGKDRQSKMKIGWVWAVVAPRLVRRDRSWPSSDIETNRGKTRLKLFSEAKNIMFIFSVSEMLSSSDLELPRLVRWSSDHDTA